MRVNMEALAEFFQFLQCQLVMEARELLGTELTLEDPAAARIWPHLEAFLRPSLGRKEKWMPFHTVLGAHELFIVQEIHNADVPHWDAFRKFLAMFIFRAHCKSELFRTVQLPHMVEEEFWEDPASHFDEEGAMSRAMLEYRQRTRQPLQTMAFRSIPARLCEHDDENLVRNIAIRTQTLLAVALRIWPILRDPDKGAATKFQEISDEVKRGRGLGDTWAKMVIVSIDIAFPEEKLLATQCNVGVGAVGGLRRILPHAALDSKNTQQALSKLAAIANRSVHISVRLFWKLLSQIEELVRQKYDTLDAVLRQLAAQTHALSAVTMQVQLCEWRQFHDFLERSNVVLGVPSGEDIVMDGVQGQSACPSASSCSPPGSAPPRRRLNGKRAAAARAMADSEDERPLVEKRDAKGGVPHIQAGSGGLPAKLLAAAEIAARMSAQASTTKEQALRLASEKLELCNSAQVKASECLASLAETLAKEELVYGAAERRAAAAGKRAAAAAQNRQPAGAVLEAVDSAASVASNRWYVLQSLSAASPQAAASLKSAWSSRVEVLHCRMEPRDEEAEKEARKHYDLCRNEVDAALARLGQARAAWEAAKRALGESEQRQQQAEVDQRKCQLACDVEAAETAALQQYIRRLTTSIT